MQSLRRALHVVSNSGIRDEIRSQCPLERIFFAAAMIDSIIFL